MPAAWRESRGTVRRARQGLDFGRAGNAAQLMGAVAMGWGNARGDVVKARGPLGGTGDGEGIA